MVPLVAETWTWWSFVIVVLICRFISRWLILGSVKRFQVDDYVMLFAVCTYTALIVTINIVSNDTTNLFPSGFDVSSLTGKEKSQRVYGSKLTVVVEQCQILTIWSVKICMLVMYGRLTVKRKENLAIKILGGYVAFTFVFMEIFYFGVWCRPFQDYWAVPTPNVQCSAAIHHLITNAVFNISSDTLILAVALPMFIKTQLPLRKKVAIVGIFSLGSFVILCAILNKYYSFTDPFGSKWTNWYVRESSTAILTANMPYLWALIRRVGHFRALDSITSNRYSYTFSQTNNNTKRSQMRSQVKSQIRTGKGPQSRTTEMDDDLLVADTESQKEGIHREIEIRVMEHDRDPSVNNEGGSGVSVSSDSDWTERWAYNHKPSEGAKISSNGGANGEMMELHALPKAVLKRQYSE